MVSSLLALLVSLSWCMWFTALPYPLYCLQNWQLDPGASLALVHSGSVILSAVTFLQWKADNIRLDLPTWCQQLLVLSIKILNSLSAAEWWRSSWHFLFPYPLEYLDHETFPSFTILFFRCGQRDARTTFCQLIRAECVQSFPPTCSPMSHWEVPPPSRGEPRLLLLGKSLAPKLPH